MPKLQGEICGLSGGVHDEERGLPAAAVGDMRNSFGGVGDTGERIDRSKRFAVGSDAQAEDTGVGRKMSRAALADDSGERCSENIGVVAARGYGDDVCRGNICSGVIQNGGRENTELLSRIGERDAGWV